MTLKAVRDELKEGSGRYDLTSSALNNIINRAIRNHLDTRGDFPKAQARHISQVAAGTYHIKMQDLRAVQAVWCADSDGRKPQLERVGIAELRNDYTDDISSITQGTPVKYAPTVIQLAPELFSIATSSAFSSASPVYEDYEDVTFGDSYDSRGITFMPPTDGTFTFNIWGLFYSKSLSADTDENWWTEQHPEAVNIACNLLLDTRYRNIQGARAWSQHLSEYLVGIQKDVIEEQVAEKNQISG